ncbi:tail fiber assembly protein [Orbaceae bacterium ESL0721]|nr:tail fiber assembly protein [Orbaceae bacterium ESL0721]
MRYQLQPEQVQFDENGIAKSAGWTLIYNCDPNTGEYQSATYEYLPVGVGLPSGAFLDAPNEVTSDKAIVRVGATWDYPNDYRGEKIYSTATGAESIQTEIGDIPANYTLLPPTSEFDSWDGDQWVFDATKEHSAAVATATSQQRYLVEEATSKISYLQDAVETEIATDDEVALLSEWKKYRVLLNRIDLEQAPNISWPVKPE